MLLWEGMVICLRWGCLLVSLAVYVGSAEPLGWLLSDKGPFHRSQEFIEFSERYQHGFTTRYKIYRYDRTGLKNSYVKAWFLRLLL